MWKILARGGTLTVLAAFGLAALAAGPAAAQKKGEERLYLQTEGLYLQRFSSDDMEWVFDDGGTSANALDNTPLADSGDIIESWNPGARVLAGLALGDKWSIEAGGFWLQPYTGEKSFVEDSAGSELQLFTSSGSNEEFDDANFAIGKYQSHIWGAEANLRNNYRGDVDWLGGVRYISLNEGAKFLFSDGEPSADFGQYEIEARNSMLGVQGGFSGTMPLTDNLSLAVKGLMGVLANSIETSQIVADNIGSATAIVRRYQDDEGFATTWMADVGLALELALTSNIALGLGYQALLLTNVALAPDQARIGATTDLAKGPDNRGRVLYHGGRGYVLWRIGGTR